MLKIAGAIYTRAIYTSWSQKNFTKGPIRMPSILDPPRSIPIRHLLCSEELIIRAGIGDNGG